MIERERNKYLVAENHKEKETDSIYFAQSSFVVNPVESIIFLNINKAEI